MWSPEQFWKATLAEYVHAIKGSNRAQTGGVEPMSRERLNELMAEYGDKTPSIRKKKR